MDKKIVPQNTITRDVKDLAAPTGNLYESVVILYKRANQIRSQRRKNLTRNSRTSRMTAIRWTKCSKTVSRSRYQNITKDSLNLFSWRFLNLKTENFHTEWQITTMQNQQKHLLLHVK